MSYTTQQFKRSDAVSSFKPLTFLFFFLLTACSDEGQDLARYVEQVKQRPAPAMEPMPALLSSQAFKFAKTQHLRDPFKVMNEQKEIIHIRPDSHRIRQPLEAYSLDDLKFVGTLAQGAQIWGLIQGPDSQIFKVQVGDYMGRNDGHIVAIQKESIKLAEIIKTASGIWKKHQLSLELYHGNQEL